MMFLTSQSQQHIYIYLHLMFVIRIGRRTLSLLQGTSSVRMPSGTKFYVRDVTELKRSVQTVLTLSYLPGARITHF